MTFKYVVGGMNLINFFLYMLPPLDLRFGDICAPMWVWRFEPETCGCLSTPRLCSAVPAPPDNKTTLVLKNFFAGKRVLAFESTCCGDSRQHLDSHRFATMLYIRARERALSPRTTLAPTNTNTRDKLESGMRCVGISQQKFFASISEMKVERR